MAGAVGIIRERREFRFDGGFVRCYALAMTTTAAQHYSDLSAEYLRKAHAHLAEGDLTQASEKGWGAAAVGVKAVAEARGVNHSTHRQIRQAIQMLAKERGDDEIRSCFGHANDLHINFYEDWLDRETIELYLSQVERLITKLDALA